MQNKYHNKEQGKQTWFKSCVLAGINDKIKIKKQTRKVGVMGKQPQSKMFFFPCPI